MERLRKHHVSFKNAFEGLIWVVRTQHNFQIHLLFSVFAIVLGIVLNISPFEMLVIIFSIFIGLVVEMVNTALESMTDLITLEWRREAKIAKDVSAAMMLVVSIGTFIIGVYIFLPKLLELI